MGHGAEGRVPARRPERARWGSASWVQAVANPILRHRLVLIPEAEVEGRTPDENVQEVLRSVEVPR